MRGDKELGGGHRDNKSKTMHVTSYVSIQSEFNFEISHKTPFPSHVSLPGKLAQSINNKSGGFANGEADVALYSYIINYLRFRANR